jgi:hypothetical protein
MTLAWSNSTSPLRLGSVPFVVDTKYRLGGIMSQHSQDPKETKADERR